MSRDGAEAAPKRRRTARAVRLLTLFIFAQIAIGTTTRNALGTTSIAMS